MALTDIGKDVLNVMFTTFSDAVKDVTFFTVTSGYNNETGEVASTNNQLMVKCIVLKYEERVGFNVAVQKESYDDGVVKPTRILYARKTDLENFEVKNVNTVKIGNISYSVIRVDSDSVDVYYKIYIASIR